MITSMLLVFGVAAAPHIEKKPLPYSIGLFEQICEAGAAQVNPQLERILKNDPQDVQAHFLKNFSVPALNSTVDRWRKVSSPKNLSSLDRMSAFFSMFLSRSENLELMTQLLDFRTSQMELELQRKTFLIHLSELKQDIEAIQQLSSALSHEDPYFSMQQLLIDLDPSGPGNFQSTWTDLQPYVRQFPSTHPYQIAFQARKLESEQGLSTETIAMYKRSYDSCQNDLDLSLMYAQVLMTQELYSEARAVIDNFMRGRKYYPIVIDETYAILSYLMGDYDTGEVYERRVRRSPLYASPDFVSTMEQVKKSKQKTAQSILKKGLLQKWSWPTVLLAIILGVLLILVVFRKQVRRNSAPKDPIDHQLLAKFEKQVKEQDQSNWVTVLRLTTGQGHDDASLAELVAKFGAAGIPASFDSHQAGIEMGAIQCYNLKIPPEFLAEAQELLDGFGLTDKKE